MRTKTTLAMPPPKSKASEPPVAIEKQHTVAPSTVVESECAVASSTVVESEPAVASSTVVESVNAVWFGKAIFREAWVE